MSHNDELWSLHHKVINSWPGEGRYLLPGTTQDAIARIASLRTLAASNNSTPEDRAMLEVKIKANADHHGLAFDILPEFARDYASFQAKRRFADAALPGKIGLIVKHTPAPVKIFIAGALALAATHCSGALEPAPAPVQSPPPDYISDRDFFDYEP